MKEQENEFFRTAAIRQCVWYKKEILKAPKPWTTNERMLETFFCNVFRSQDKTTICLVNAVDKLLEKFLHWDEITKWIIIFRQFSRIETIVFTMEHIIPDVTEGNTAHNVALLDERLYERNKAHALYTGGFLVSGSVKIKAGGTHKIPGYLYKNVPNGLFAIHTIEACWNVLNACPGIGGFMAYEYVTDFSYWKDYPDKFTWANPGPGAKRGMQRITRDFTHISQSRYLPFARELLAKWYEYVLSSSFEETVRLEGLDPEIIRPYFEKLSMREVEHWLCEYDKYCRPAAQNKRNYNGRA